MQQTEWLARDSLDPILYSQIPELKETKTAEVLLDTNGIQIKQRHYYMISAQLSQGIWIYMVSAIIMMK